MDCRLLLSLADARLALSHLPVSHTHSSPFLSPSLPLSPPSRQFYADACFRPFEVTGDIDLPLALGGLDGKAANLVIAPAGTWAVRFVACACAFLFAYRLWLRFALVLHGGVTEGCCACFVRSALCWLHPVSLLDAAAAEEAEMVELDGGNKGGGAMAAGGGDAGSPQGERMQRVAHEAMMLQSLVLSTPGHAAEQAKGQTEQVL